MLAHALCFMKALRLLAALALALPLSTASARPAAQSGGTDFDGNGVTDARDLVSFVAQWVIDAGLSVTPSPTPTPVPSTATATPAPTLTRTATPVPPTATRTQTIAASPTHTAAPTSTPQLPGARRIVVVVLENRNLTDVQAEPYFASLAARGRLLTNYLTIANPSQPNYVALNFGDTMGVVDNSLVDIAGRNIVDQLEEAGVSWRTYHEAYPGGCYAGYYPPGNTLYARKHNAFISANSVRNNSARCAKIVDGNAFEADVASDTLPRYSVYVPDENNSSHDTSIAYAATWLQGWLDPKLANPSLKDVLWVITWDEGEVNGPVPISTILIGPGITPGSTDGAQYTHYSLLRTVQQFFGLGSLGRNDATAPLIPLGGGALPTPTATSPPASATATRTATFLPVITQTSTRTSTPTATRTPGGSSMAFGDVSVLDAFTRADGGLGSNWTTDAASDGASAPRIVSNQAACVSGGGYSSAYHNVASFTGNKQAYMTLSTLPESPRYAGIGFVIGPGASVDGYHVEYRVGTGILIYRIDNTVFTQLGAAISWTPSNGHKLGIRVDETNGVIEAWTHNGTSWSQAGTRSDSTYTGAAYGEIYIRGNSTRVDDFAAGSESSPVSVSPAATTVVAATVAPSVVLGNVSVSPAAVSAVAASVNPTVVAGAISFTPSVVTIVTTSVAPTVVTGPVSVTPAAATAVAASVAPTVVQSSQTVAPSPVTAVAASVSPTTVAGSLSLAPSPASAVIATVAPSVVQSSQTVAPAASTAVVASVAPTVQTSGVDVAPAAASAVIASVAPAVVLGSQSVAPAAASAVIATVNPTVSAGGNLTIAPDPASAVAASVAPSVVLGSVNVAPNAASAVIATVAPSVGLGSTSVTPAAVSAVAVSVNPTVVAGSLLLSPPSVTAVAASVAPSVILGNVSVTAPAASAAIVTIAPTVVSGSTIAAPAAASVVILTVAPDVPTSGAVIAPDAAWAVIDVGQPQVIAPVGQAIDHPGRTGAGLRIGGGVSVRASARVGARVGGRTRVR